MAAPQTLRIAWRHEPLPEVSPATPHHRLILELRDTKPLDDSAARAYLRQLADLCGWRPAGEPLVSPLEEGGCAAWLHTTAGGAQLRSWGEPAGLVTIDVLARRAVDAEQVLRFSALCLEARQAVAADPARPGEHWRLSAEATQLRQLCEWAIGEARSGRDLARATTLVVGAGLAEELGPELLERIASGIAELHATSDPRLALAHGEGLGEALMLLRHAGVDTTAVAPTGEPAVAAAGTTAGEPAVAPAGEPTGKRSGR